MTDGSDVPPTPSGTVDDDMRWERALAAAGSGDSGLGDVSENHDEYFAQAIEEHMRESRSHR